MLEKSLLRVRGMEPRKHASADRNKEKRERETEKERDFELQLSYGKPVKGNMCFWVV